MTCLVSHPASQSLVALGLYRPAEKVSGSEYAHYSCVVLSELANCAPKAGLVCGNAIFGVLSIQKQKREAEFAQLGFLSVLGIAA